MSNPVPWDCPCRPACCHGTIYVYRPSDLGLFAQADQYQRTVHALMPTLIILHNSTNPQTPTSPFLVQSLDST